MSFKSPDRFLKLGLRSNPFSQRNHSELVQIFGADEWLKPLLQSPWQVLAIYGKSGHGKTTAAHMLMALARQRNLDVVYCRLQPRSVRWPRETGKDMTVIDSIQRMPSRKRSQYRRLVRPEHRLLLVGQEDITGHDGGVLRVTPPKPDASEVQRHFSRYVGLAVLPGFPSNWELPAASARVFLAGTGRNRFQIVRALYHGFELIADGETHLRQLDRNWAMASLAAAKAEAQDVVEDER